MNAVRIHVLGLGLSYDDAYNLARAKGVPERYLDTHDVDDALNAYFTRRGHATACVELLPHERPAGTDFEYCVITNFRVVSTRHQSKSAWNIFDERPRADEWTARVSEALLPGANYQGLLMRMVLEEWGAGKHSFIRCQELALTFNIQPPPSSSASTNTNLAADT